MSIKDTCVSLWEALTVTIPSGAALSETINLGGLRLFGIIIPALWTAATLTFQISIDGGVTWVDLRTQDGDEITASSTASSCSIVDPVKFACVQYLRIRSGSNVAPVDQTAERQVQLLLRSV